MIWGRQNMRCGWTLAVGLSLVMSIVTGCTAAVSDVETDDQTFLGVRSVTKNPDGTWRVNWDVAAGDSVMYWLFVADLEENINWDEPFAGLVEPGYTTEDLTFVGNRCYAVRISSDAYIQDSNENILCTGHEKFEFRGAQSLVQDRITGHLKLVWDVAPVKNPEFFVFRRPYNTEEYEQQPFVATKQASVDLGLPKRGQRFCYKVSLWDVDPENAGPEFCHIDEPDFQFNGINALEFTGSTTSLRVTWIPSTDSFVTHYLVLGGANSETELGSVPASAVQNNLVIEDIQADQLYTFAVKAVDAFGRQDSNIRQLSVRGGTTNVFDGANGESVTGSLGSSYNDNVPPTISDNTVGTLSNPFVLTEDVPSFTTEELTIDEGSPYEDLQVLSFMFRSSDSSKIGPAGLALVHADDKEVAQDDFSDFSARSKVLSLVGAANAVSLTPIKFTLVVENPGTPYASTERDFYAIINPVNDPPEIFDVPELAPVLTETVPGQTVSPGQSQYHFTFKVRAGPANGTDEFDQPLTLMLTSSNEAIVQSQNLSYQLSTLSTGESLVTLTVQPEPYKNGSLAITVVANDGELNSESAVIPIQIAQYNNLPAISRASGIVEAPTTGTISNPFLLTEDQVFVSGEDLFIDEGGDESEDSQVLAFSWLTEDASTVKPLKVQVLNASDLSLGSDNFSDSGVIARRIRINPEANQVAASPKSITLRVSNPGTPSQLQEYSFYYLITPVNDLPEWTETLSSVVVKESDNGQTIPDGQVEYTYTLGARAGPEGAIDEYSEQTNLIFTSSDPTIIDASKITYTRSAPAVNSTVTYFITVRPEPDAAGSVDIDVDLSDTDFTISTTTNVVVQGVNDYPDIQLTAADASMGSLTNPLSVSEDNLTDFDADFGLIFDEGGGADENIESVNVTFISSNQTYLKSNNIFLVDGAGNPVAADGAGDFSQAGPFYIRFVPEPNVHTTDLPNPIKVTVTASDNGMPARSTAREIFLRIVAVNDLPSVATSEALPIVINENTTSDWIRLSLTEGGLGNPHEGAQNLYVTITSDDHALLNPATAITYHASNSPSSNLFLFKISTGSNVAGTANLTVTVGDAPAGDPERLEGELEIPVQISAVDDPPAGQIYCRIAGTVKVTITQKSADTIGTELVCSGSVDEDSVLSYEISDNTCDLGSQNDNVTLTQGVDGANRIATLTVKKQVTDCEMYVTAVSQGLYADSSSRHKLTVLVSRIDSIAFTGSFGLDSQCRMSRSVAISSSNSAFNVTAGSLLHNSAVADATLINWSKLMTFEELHWGADNGGLRAVFQATSDLGHEEEATSEPIIPNISFVSNNFATQAGGAGNVQTNIAMGSQNIPQPPLNSCINCDGLRGSIVTGRAHSCSVNGDGNVACWGDSVGTGFASDSNKAKVVSGFSDARVIAAGDDHNCVIRGAGTAGSVSCFGSNSHSQLGSGLPGSGYTSVAAGSRHSCALSSLGTAICWGDNTFGQLGNGTTTSSASPVSVSMPGGVTFVGLSAGGATTCALASNQKIYCWGANGSNQMDNTNLTHSDVPTIVPFSNALYLAVGGAAAGTGFVCIIESAGSVRCKGAISGLPTGQFASISAGSGHVCGVRPSGLVRCFGGSGNKINTSLEGVAAISAGGEHSCALMADGSAKCWGSRLDGRLGDGNSSGTTSVPQGVIVEGGTDPFEAQINACRIYQVIN